MRPIPNLNVGDIEIDVLREVASAAAQILTAPPRRAAAITYLRQRGIDTSSIPSGWPLGYAPPGWTRLIDALVGQFPDEALLAAGVARRSSRGTLIDTFRDRVIFPIHLTDGQVAGFTGRDLSGSSTAPKYLNSPQSALFDKGSLLYGLREGQTIKSPAATLVVVEGPLDALAIVGSSKTGELPELMPVAACGTAFTITHARHIAAIAPGAPVVVAMDGDAAGRSAATTTGELLRHMGLDARVALLPNGLDPSDFVTQGGDPAVFAPTAALPLLTVHVERAIAAQGDRMQWIEGRLAAGRAIASYLATYPAEHAARQIGWISQAVAIEASVFTDELVDAYRTARTTAGRDTYRQVGSPTRPIAPSFSY